MEIKKILSSAKEIIDDNDLCNTCLGRLFSKKLHLKSNSLLGKKIRLAIKNSESKRCYICKNAFLHLNEILEKLIKISEEYQFETFEIGIILKPSILDNDDLIRSKYKIHADSIKSDVAKEISKMFSRHTKKKVDHMMPDLLFTINLKDDSIFVRTKSLYLSGSYIKKEKGLSQKQTQCKKCYGKGCPSCSPIHTSGSASVEEIITRYIIDKFGCLQCRFTWIGGEDKNSLVLGSGRPFYVKLINPKKRQIRLPKSISLDTILIKNLGLVHKIPKMPLGFISQISAEVICNGAIHPDSLKLLKRKLQVPIVVYENTGRRTEKAIQKINIKKLTDSSFKILFWADGGLPIKRFVNGDNVAPNISALLSTQCRCDNFDFLEIKLK